MEEKFIKFLQANNAYRQYMYNLAYCPSGTMSWPYYKDRTPEIDWIFCAFEFHQSKEGNDFWFPIAIKWHNLLDKQTIV